MNEQNIMQFAPIAIFTYKRLDTLKLSIDSLLKCKNAENSEVYIFSDGPKKENDREEIEKVRDFIKSIKGFKKVITKFSDVNKGLADSIIGGVTSVINEHGSIIVLEDDLLVSSNFLSYMNSALYHYKNDDKVFSVSGYTPPIKSIKNQYEFDNYFTLRGSSWGWATWKENWKSVDWEMSTYNDFLKDKTQQKEFNRMGSDMCKMLTDQKKGQINSWAIRWCFHQFNIDQYTVFPIRSKISNVGFGEDATHTSGDDKRYITPLDNSDIHQFNFNNKVELDSFFIKQFTVPYSLKTRIYYKIKKSLKL